MSKASQSLVRDLKALAAPERALANLRFFKTGKGEYGEGDRFLGVTMPQVRAVAKEHAAGMTLADIDTLLASPWHEVRMAALVVMMLQYKKADTRGRKAFFDSYRSNVLRHNINNWDLVDVSAPHIVGAWCAEQGDWRVLKTMARSTLLWERRVAIIATFAFLAKRETAPSYALAELLVHDAHDLMHKAVGWTLREMAKRCSVVELHRFLRAYAATMPRTALRYAIERLSPDERRYWMTFRATE